LGGYLTETSAQVSLLGYPLAIIFLLSIGTVILSIILSFYSPYSLILSPRSSLIPFFILIILIILLLLYMFFAIHLIGTQIGLYVKDLTRLNLIFDKKLFIRLIQKITLIIILSLFTAIIGLIYGLIYI